MRAIHLFRVAAVCIVLKLCPFVNGAFSQTQLKSGIYEGLRLAVDAHGAVTGYYRDVQGSGVTKTCSFFLFGREKGDAADVVTWNIEAFPGSLKSAKEGVVLRIENGRDHPGCASVLPPLISEGMLLDLDARTDWTSLRRVTAKKSFLLQKPNARKGRSYLLIGDVVGVLSKSRDWLSVEYANEGKRVRGWIRAADTAELKPP
jgi:hypothetical protein